MTCGLGWGYLLTCSLGWGYLLTCSLGWGCLLTCSLEWGYLLTCSLGWGRCFLPTAAMSLGGLAFFDTGRWPEQGEEMSPETRVIPKVQSACTCRLTLAYLYKDCQNLSSRSCYLYHQHPPIIPPLSLALSPPPPLSLSHTHSVSATHTDTHSVSATHTDTHYDTHMNTYTLSHTHACTQMCRRTQNFSEPDRENITYSRICIMPATPPSFPPSPPPPHTHTVLCFYEVYYPVFTRMPGVSYHRRIRSVVFV